MRRPRVDESVSPRIFLGNCLNEDVSWSRTNDPAALWRARVGPQAWAVRVNDFPEDHLYTLLIDDQEVGDFDDWPIRWLRFS
jgi:hypothetical protein